MINFRAFKVLIGAPTDTPNGEMELPPGHKHSLLITPTFIGLVNIVKIFNEPYTVCEWFLVAPLWT